MSVEPERPYLGDREDEPMTKSQARYVERLSQARNVSFSGDLTRGEAHEFINKHQHDWLTRDGVRKVPCPARGARPGRPCVGGSGPRQANHTQRVQQARNENTEANMSPKSVELMLEPDEADAIWKWLNHYYPDSQEVLSSAFEKFGDAMDRAGIDTEDFSSKFEDGPPYLASGV